MTSPAAESWLIVAAAAAAADLRGVGAAPVEDRNRHRAFESDAGLYSRNATKGWQGTGGKTETQTTQSPLTTLELA